MRRIVGAAAGGTLALALLVCGCVFTAMAGPALSLHTRSQALLHELAGLPPATKSVQVAANWRDFIQAASLREQSLDEGTLAESTVEIGNGLATTPLPLGDGAWASLNTFGLLVTAGAAASAYTNVPPRLAVYYREPFTSYAHLTAGSYDAASVPSGMVGVAATTATAARFGLHPGSRLTVRIPGGQVTMVVTAIVAVQAPGSTFWSQDSTPAQPALQGVDTKTVYWLGGLIADPGQLGAMQNAFSGPGLEMSWDFPLSVGGLTANQAQGLDDALTRATTVAPALTGSMAQAATLLTASSALLTDLNQFLAAQAAVTTVLLLLFVSLIVVGAAVILLAARMIAARRADELVMLRARGGSVWQVAVTVARGTALAAVPAALAGAALAIAVIPGNSGGAGSGATGWALAGFALAVALAGPPLIAAWRHRRPAPALNQAWITVAGGGRRRRMAWRRPVAEVTAVAASIGGLVVLHDQGVSTAGGVNLYLTVTPVLVAVPVVLVLLRLYPLVVRCLLTLSARRAGATGFVALSGAARSSLIGVLPAFGLVLALTLATFAGMLSQGIAQGETAASWQATGADVQISAGPESVPVSPAEVQAIAAVTGVRHVTAAWTTTWATSAGQPITAIAVDPASYAAVTAGTPFPPFPGLKPSGGSTIPVLASPTAAALLGQGSVALQNTQSPIGPITVRVTGPQLSSTPAVPGGGAFIVMPLQNLPGLLGRPAPNLVLVTGSSIDDAQLAAVTNKAIVQNSTLFRSQVLAGLSNSPLQHGATLIITLTIASAAAFGLFIVMLGVALGSADREMTVARLAVMGHERATWLIMTEALPAVIAAIAGGVICAVVLPHAIGSAIDLSAFTGTSVPVGFQLDAAALGLPAAAIAVLAVAVLAGQARALRRHGITGLLRTN
jgi:putative ABC transport system permease protein